MDPESDVAAAVTDAWETLSIVAVADGTPRPNPATPSATPRNALPKKLGPEPDRRCDFPTRASADSTSSAFPSRSPANSTAVDVASPFAARAVAVTRRRREDEVGLARAAFAQVANRAATQDVIDDVAFHDAGKLPFTSECRASAGSVDASVRREERRRAVALREFASSE
jgi:hypothetical protein|tara:strand:- start:942 stop:1451 length:510 start_codon:yes stop_codon:yes gene_type:complete|mmetsp:Transcript_12743/g.45785  ORF Transcript_12743/g.45785 Transcript_12743/m.45785 type:complete len:170 (-) Transcript_12743:94-603(-)